MIEEIQTKLKSELCKQQRTVTLWLQSFGTRNSFLANSKIICYCTVIALFSLYLRAISKYKPPGGLSEGRFNGGILRYEFGGGLYLEGLIFGILQ